MKYTTEKEICKEFGLSETTNTDELIKQLTLMQVNLHPEKNNKFSEEDLESYSKIVEAKNFLRKNKNKKMVSVSENKDLMRDVNTNGDLIVKHSEVLSNDFARTTENVLKNIKKRYLHKKVTVTVMSGIVTFLWSFPSLILEHPVFGKIISEDVLGYEMFQLLFMFFTFIWLLVLLLALLVLCSTYKRESFVKSVLTSLENEDNQGEIFMEFVEQCEECRVEKFDKLKLESFIACKLRMSLFRKLKEDEQLFSGIKEILPKISEVIIFKAMEQSLIKKDESSTGWYDSYIII